MNMVDKIIAFENGDMTEEEVIHFFQDLVDSGDAWRLQGSYGRMATALIDQGLVIKKTQKDINQEQAEDEKQTTQGE